jgi:hypothetical protein
VVTQLRKHFKEDDEANWTDLIAKGKIKIADADLNEDGIEEKFIMVNTSDWCGSAGCQGLILQKRGRCWELISEATFSEEETIVLDRKQFGYHELYTSKMIYTFRNGRVHDIVDLLP